MEAIDGYRRAALALQALDAEERQWLLSQLDAEDRERVAALLRHADGPQEAASGAAANSKVPAPPMETAAPSDIAVIESTHGETLGAVLQDQPEWVVALVLAHCAKNMALRRYVDQLPPPRGARIHGLVKPMRDAVKPRVRDFVLQRVAAEAKHLESMGAKAADFDAMVTNLSARR
jgi:hypothetical protein